MTDIGGFDKKRLRTSGSTRSLVSIVARRINYGLKSHARSASRCPVPPEASQCEALLLRCIVRLAARELLYNQVGHHYALVSSCLDSLASYQLYSALLESIHLCAFSSLAAQNQQVSQLPQRLKISVDLAALADSPCQLTNPQKQPQQQTRRQTQRPLQQALRPRPRAVGSRIPVPIKPPAGLTSSATASAKHSVQQIQLVTS